ncbi:hypothetical protein ACP70R_007606 [Stipagrostis hirtigluma subsp. patula]
MAPAARDEHLDALRALMAAHSPPLHALLIPSEDAHQSEYATQQLSGRWKPMRMGEDPPVETWIADNLPNEAVIGIDPWCISVDSAQRYEQAFSKKHQILFQLSSDLVDEVWKDRPLVKPLPVIVHPVEFAGRSVSEKIKELREKLVHEKASAIIITALDEDPERVHEGEIHRNPNKVDEYLGIKISDVPTAMVAGYILEDGCCGAATVFITPPALPKKLIHHRAAGQIIEACHRGATAVLILPSVLLPPPPGCQGRMLVTGAAAATVDLFTTGLFKTTC